MLENLKIRTASPVTQVLGPVGELLTLDTIPSPDTNRWVARRKAEVVAAVRGGLLTIGQACERYDLTPEEYASWERAIERAGLPGLRATHMQRHRDLCRSTRR